MRVNSNQTAARTMFCVTTTMTALAPVNPATIQNRAAANVISLTHLILVPKLCLGTHVFETPFRLLRTARNGVSKTNRSQTEFGNEEAESSHFHRLRHR